MSERALQRQIRQFLAHSGFASVHVPNGTKLAGDDSARSRQARNLIADGMLPGYPDLIVYAKGGRVGHIEVKSPTGTIQPTQHACADWLRGLGHHYAVCRSIDDTRAALIAWGWI